MTKKKQSGTPEELLEQALVPESEQPYEVPENWVWANIDSVAKLYTGNSINAKVKEEKYYGKNEGLNFIATKDISFENKIDYDNGVRITDFENFKIAPKDSSLLCIEGGSAGRKVGYLTEDVCFGNKLCAFVSRGVVDKYVYCYLQSSEFSKQFNKEHHGLIGGVSINLLKMIAFPLPPLAEQQRIVDRIESLFEKLDQAKGLIQDALDSFENRKAAILHKAFSGELTRKWREENGGEIWETCVLGDVIIEKPRNGYSPVGVAYITKYKNLTLTATTSGVFRGDYFKYVDIDIQDDSHLLLKKDDILIQRANSLEYVGTCAIYNGNDNEYIYPDLMMKVRANSLTITKYLYYILSTGEVKEYYRNNATGTAGNMPKINQKVVINTPLVLPPLEEQKEIVTLLDDLFEKEQNAKELINIIDNIDRLKKSVLARAFRGELGTNDPAEDSALELLKEVLAKVN